MNYTAMFDKCLIVVIIFLLRASILLSQCAGRDSIELALAYSSGTSVAPDSEKLRVLLHQDQNIQACPDYKYDSLHYFVLKVIAELYYKNADYLQAIQYYRQAINLIYEHKDFSPAQAKNLVSFYYDLSEAYDALHNSPQRVESLDSAVAVGIRLQSVTRRCLWSLYCKILYFFDIGDYSRCIESANMCESLGKEYAAGPNEKVLPGGLMYASTGLHWNITALLALNRYAEAEELLIDRIETGKLTHGKFNLGTLYAQLAEVLARKKDYKKALFYFRKAFNEDEAQRYYLGCKMILNNTGYFIYYLNNSNLDSALYYYQRALNFRSSRIPHDKSFATENLNILNSIADAFVRKGSFDSAFKYLQLAFDQIEPGAEEEKIMKNSHYELDNFGGKIWYLANLFIAKGTAYHRLYKLTGNSNDVRRAMRIYKLTDQLLDRIKAGQFETESKLFWRSDVRRLYEQALAASFSMNNADDAFYFFEKSRAVILNDQLNEQRWVGEADIAQQTQLKLRIKLLQEETSKGEVSGEKRKALEEKLFNFRQELDALIQRIKVKNPLYYQSFIDSIKISTEEFKSRILKDHEVFIEIFVGDSAVYELILTKEKNHLKIINKNEFDRLSGLFLTYVSDPVASNSHYGEFIATSRELYDLLFRGIIIPNGRVIISPDGTYFPFEALTTSADGGRIRYFLKDHSVSYTYSGRYLLSDFGIAELAASKQFIGFAPVIFNNKKLVDLAGSDISLNKLSAYFPKGDQFIGEQARKRNFLEKFYSYQIIQLYTHATASGHNGEPMIWFADSSVVLSELMYERKPLTKLVVLSACETAKGRLYKGEGIFGLNRGFAALGIPSCISTLWMIENKSSYKITELFYKFLAKGIPTDVALQKAKLEFLSQAGRDKEIPYYWASLVSIGINEKFDVKGSGLWNLPVIAVAMAIMAMGIVFIAYRKYARTSKGMF